MNWTVAHCLRGLKIAWCGLPLLLLGCQQSPMAAPKAPTAETRTAKAPVMERAPMPVADEVVDPGYGQKDQPPDFTLKVLANGKGKQELSLSSFVGPSGTGTADGAVVAFVASWCGRCKDSYATLQELQSQHGDRLKIMLLTSETEEEGKAAMVKILEERKITLPLLDAPPALVDTWLGTKKNIPRFYLLDHTGTIRVKDTGFGKKMERMLPEHVDWLLSTRFDKPTP